MFVMMICCWRWRQWCIWEECVDPPRQFRAVFKILLHSVYSSFTVGPAQSARPKKRDTWAMRDQTMTGIKIGGVFVRDSSEWGEVDCGSMVWMETRTISSEELRRRRGKKSIARAVKRIAGPGGIEEEWRGEERVFCSGGTGKEGHDERRGTVVDQYEKLGEENERTKCA